MRALVAALTRSARGVESRTGVTNAQLFVLQQLADEPELSVGELAARAMVGQNAVSTVLARLARRGLVARERASGDGRRVLVRLTAAGRRITRRAPASPTARLIAALERLAAPDVAALAKGLAALNAALDEHAPAAGMLFEAARSAHTRRAARPAGSASTVARRRDPPPSDR